MNRESSDLGGEIAPTRHILAGSGIRHISSSKKGTMRRAAYHKSGLQEDVAMVFEIDQEYRPRKGENLA